jgi:activator of 2-hydroxyglutaryl-CoA dehydratase
MLFVDAGSSWCKLFSPGDDEVQLLTTRQALGQGLAITWGTGHSARSRAAHFENDLISLSRGALTLIDAPDFTVLDLGSRDAKLVGVKARKPAKLDWSVGCAAATGATLEMLGHFYQIDFAALAPTKQWTPVTCGTYAVERIMDAVSAGDDVELALAKFVHGLARNAFDFAGRPPVLHLSGGFTANPAFCRALSGYTEVIPLGRTVPLAGLWALAADQGELGPIPAALAESRCRGPHD